MITSYSSRLPPAEGESNSLSTYLPLPAERRHQRSRFADTTCSISEPCLPAARPSVAPPPPPVAKQQVQVCSREPRYGESKDDASHECICDGICRQALSNGYPNLDLCGIPYLPSNPQG
jgi:hypothetical protein